MDILLYFAFGVLNVGLLYLITNIYRDITGIDLFPGRSSGDKSDMILSILAYIFCGAFGTVVIFMLGIFLFIMWWEYYRKK
jgi:hypothetical protein